MWHSCLATKSALGYNRKLASDTGGAHWFTMCLQVFTLLSMFNRQFSNGDLLKPHFTALYWLLHYGYVLILCRITRIRAIPTAKNRRDEDVKLFSTVSFAYLMMYWADLTACICHGSLALVLSAGGHSIIQSLYLRTEFSMLKDSATATNDTAAWYLESHCATALVGVYNLMGVSVFVEGIILALEVAQRDGTIIIMMWSCLSGCS